MTTIAYCKEDNTISCDSQLNLCEGRGLSENKIKQHDDYIYAGRGVISDIDYLVNCYKNDLPVDKDLNATAILIEKETKKAFLISFSSESKLISKSEIKCNFALGSGRELAIGAMTARAGSDEAVWVAIQHDIYSGGDIHTFDIDSWKFS